VIPPVHKERAQAVLALCLTCGEFVAAGFLLVHEGHTLALYLAVTYALRETPGGKHYRELVVAAFKRAYRRKEHTSCGQ
jgi:hypothetical protein